MVSPNGFCSPPSLPKSMSLPIIHDELSSKAKDIAARALLLLESWTGSDGHQLSVEELKTINLAHYTSLDAIVSMLQTPEGGLRLSDTSTMNDFDEGRATLDGRIINDYLENDFGKESWLWKRYSAAHVACFVGIPHTDERMAHDDLLFWRLYGNDCRGVSISIPPHRSEVLVKSSIVNRVIYTDADKQSVKIDSSFVSLLKDLDNLRQRARTAGLWHKINPTVLPSCDGLLKQRFLRKGSHYDMEREYRAVAFLSEDDTEDSHYPVRGRHVQYGLVRRYVQIPELSCESIFTTDSRINIGSNVSNRDDAKASVSALLCERGKAPGVVSVGISKFRYRAR